MVSWSSVLTQRVLLLARLPRPTIVVVVALLEASSAIAAHADRAIRVVVAGVSAHAFVAGWTGAAVTRRALMRRVAESTYGTRQRPKVHWIAMTGASGRDQCRKNKKNANIKVAWGHHTPCCSPARWCREQREWLRKSSCPGSGPSNLFDFSWQSLQSLDEGAPATLCQARH